MSRGGWAPYVPVARRRAAASRAVKALRKKGMVVEPVVIEGRKIARTFWGEGWCRHLEGFGDFANRLPRGRTYVRNGSVCHLEIVAGRVEALVSGSRMYEVRVEVETLAEPRWAALRERCAGHIGSMLDLLRGQLSKDVMAVVTHRDQGLFPRQGEIRFRCSCPDWALMCKHVAAVLYGVGARLDHRPGLLFLLRGVDHQELIRVDPDAVAAATGRGGRRRRIAEDDLGDVFGIDLGEADAGTAPRRPAPKAASGKKPAPKKPARKMAVTGGRGAAKSSHVPAPRAGAPATAQGVADLRDRLGVTRGEFARLLGVSPVSVANWERAERPLNLQARTAKALATAAGLTKRQARARLAAGKSTRR